MIILYSLPILLGIALMVSAPVIGELRPLFGGIIILTIGIWNLKKRLQKQTTTKQTGFEKTLEDISKVRKIKL